VMPDPDSITAWMARATLRDLGLDPSKERLGTTRYQDGIPFMMENGFYQVGITAANGVARQWANRGGRIVHESPAVPIKQVIAASDMSEADYQRIRDLFLSLDQTDRGRAVLTGLGFQGFDRADDAALARATQWLGL
jgi:phosphonate transport system substrate-binding protein